MRFVVVLFALLAATPAHAETRHMVEAWGDAFSACRNEDPSQSEAARRKACTKSAELEKKLKRAGCHIAFSTTWKCGNRSY